ncbi:hypothetical protein CWS72_02175 [Telmatospirillum siberiense]|uniref:FkbM family methyltransferase n=1 Tax=Telmatospirillum siberiense TaxID=382514 RepID=A0A2N3Q033_9PROT|nr:hypothetical protein CWS72_02175 [Telmatospirillum siberiense]
MSDFQLERLIADYGCRFFVETGTGEGVDAEFAATFAFDHVYSIEKVHGLAIKVAFRNARNLKMTVVHAQAERGLKMVLDEIPPHAPVLFWMDTEPSFDASQSSSPLERDLRLIASLRDVVGDVFLIDDLRLYESGVFEDGPCPVEAMAPSGQRNLDFVEDIFGKTHHLQRLARQTGYLCAYPIRRQSDA